MSIVATRPQSISSYLIFVHPEVVDGMASKGPQQTCTTFIPLLLLLTQTCGQPPYGERLGNLIH